MTARPTPDTVELMDITSRAKGSADPRRYGVVGLVLLVIGLVLSLAGKPAFVVAGTALLTVALLLLVISWLRVRKINSGNGGLNR